MDRRTFIKALPALTVLADAVPSFAQEPASPATNLQPIILPKPEKDGGKSVLAALWERKTNRNISEQKLPLQMLSNLLWAAWGVNRESGPRGQIGRTAASASNSQEIDLYVAMAEGIYLYEAVPHRLAPVVAGDHRAKASRRGRCRGSGTREPDLRRRYRQVRQGTASGTGTARSGDPEVLLQRGDGADRRQRLFVRRFPRLGGVVP